MNKPRLLTNSSNASHPKPPSIPVRMNRRVTLKPLSEMQGDNLPMLKKLKTSELSQQVRGHNASEENRKKRLLKQWFGEQQYQIEKMKRRQDEMFQALTRIHKERRELQREMYIWHQEEDRVHRIMREQSRKVIAESQRISEEVAIDKNELFLIPIKKRKRRMSQLHAALIEENRLNPSYSSSPVTGSPRPADIDAIAESPGLPLSPILKSQLSENSRHSSAMKISHTSEEDSPKSGRGSAIDVSDMKQSTDSQVAAPTRKRGVFMRSSALEVTKDSLHHPIAREKSMELKADDNDNKEGSSTSAERSQRSSLPLEEHPKANEPRGILKLPPIRKVYISPHETIQENQELQPFSATKPTNNVDENPEIMHVTILNSPEQDSDNEEHIINPLFKKRKSQVKAIREIRKIRELEMRKQLEEDFTAYRMDSNGEILPLEQHPAAYPTDEPTNKDKYKTERILNSERRHFLDHVIQLKRYTADMISEELRKKEEYALLQASLNARKTSNERDKTSLSSDELPDIGPLTWIRVFMHSNLPPGIDPNSVEALKYCRYIRHTFAQMTPEEQEEIMKGHPIIINKTV